ncbi:hypothetical protein ACWD4J_14790 [Streptomyces sp. NPDC002577]
MRAVYGRRHARLAALLARSFPDRLHPVSSAAGLHLSAYAPADKEHGARAVVRRARAAGVMLHSLSEFRYERPAPVGFAFGYGGVDEDCMEDGMARFSQALGLP